MAQRVTVELEDDLDGGPADETLRFGLGGTDYEIDLSKKNASKLRQQIVPYIEHARKAGRGQRRRPTRTASSREHTGDIRAWAKDQGLAVSECGRIPASFVEQYEAATTGHDASRFIFGQNLLQLRRAIPSEAGVSKLAEIRGALLAGAT